MSIRAIAKAAGVSITTVSRVLNHHPYVSEEKKERVLKVMHEQNYIRNVNAVHLSVGKTNVIGVVLPYLDRPYHARLLRGIASTALQHGYQILLFQTNYKTKEERKALEALKTKQVDGLIICSTGLNWESVQSYASYGPIVACENTEKFHIPCVYANHYTAFYEGLIHLYERGYHDIALCIGKSDSVNGIQRKQAYVDFMKHHQLPFHSEWIIENSFEMEFGETLQDGEHILTMIQSLKNHPRALFVWNDFVAASIYKAAIKRNVSIPDDLALLGFDNQPYSELLDISTIYKPSYSLGTEACMTLVDLMHEKNTTPLYKELKSRFIQRNST